MDTFLKLLLVTCVTALVVLMGYLLFLAVDSIGVETSPQMVSVTNKHYTPAHTTTTFITGSNGTMTPIITYHPDSWSVTIRYGNEFAGCPVSERQYNDAVIGGSVVAYVKAGRISGDTYCDGIRS